MTKKQNEEAPATNTSSIPNPADTAMGPKFSNINVMDRRKKKRPDVLKRFKEYLRIHTPGLEEENGDDFKPHMMYDPKTGKGYEAKTMDDHLRMTKMGYNNQANVKEQKDDKKGLWYNIHQRRKKGLPPKKPGEEGYPKTLNIDKKDD